MSSRSQPDKIRCHHNAAKQENYWPKSGKRQDAWISQADFEIRHVTNSEQIWVSDRSPTTAQSAPLSFVDLQRIAWNQVLRLFGFRNKFRLYKKICCNKRIQDPQPLVSFRNSGGFHLCYPRERVFAPCARNSALPCAMSKTPARE